MGLEKTTYFTERNVVVAAITAVKPTPGYRCPPGTFLDLEGLTGKRRSGV
jgi:hypothetical protein